MTLKAKHRPIIRANSVHDGKFLSYLNYINHILACHLLNRREPTYRG